MITPLHVKPNNKVDLWWLGPSEPKEPTAPEAIGGMLAPDEALKFGAEVREYREKKAAYDKWVEAGSEPRVVEMAATDAVHALKVDPERWSTERPGAEAEEAKSEPVQPQGEPESEEVKPQDGDEGLDG